MIILSTLNHLKESVVNNDETTENNHNDDDYYDYQYNNNIDVNNDHDQDDHLDQSENDDDGQYDPVEIQLTYEEVDQLRCYLQCAILPEEDVTIDLDHNYESLGFDAVAEIGRPGVRMNIGVDSFEFLANLQPFMKIIQPIMTIGNIKDFFANVDTTPERSVDRLLLMLKFLEMIPMDTSIDLTDMTAIVDMSMLIYTYSFYQLAMNSSSNDNKNDNDHENENGNDNGNQKE